MSKLPKVSKDTIASVARYIDENTKMGEEAFKDLIDQMNKSNPHVLEIILKYARANGSGNLDQMKIATCGLTIYKLLQSQMEANSLKDLMDIE